MTLTMDSLLAAQRVVQAMAPTPSLRITYSQYALKETTERLFPESRHRSKRVRKKLIKRFGAEFRKTPCMWRVGDTIVAHPSFKAQLEAATVPVQLSAYQRPEGS